MDIINKKLLLPGIVDPSNHDTTILVIGCGGTGGYFVRDAARLMSDLKESGANIVKMILVDGDKVEYKNIARQNFTFNDIGKYKAEVLANRYSRAFGINISYLNEYFSIDVADKFIDKINVCSNILIFSFVDNVITRKMLHDFYIKLYDHYLNTLEDSDNIYNVVYIDAGNLKYAGQVVVSSIHSAIVENFNISNFYRYSITPDVFLLHPDLIEVNDSIIQEVSCAEAAQEDPQTICANLTSANVSISVFYDIMMKILSVDNISYLPYNEIYFDAQFMRTTPVMIESTREFPDLKLLLENTWE